MFSDNFAIYSELMHTQSDVNDSVLLCCLKNKF